MEDQIKKAFNKVKEDIEFLNSKIFGLNTVIDNFKLQIKELDLLTKTTKNELEHLKLTKPLISTDQHIIPINIVSPTDNPTHNYILKDLKYQILDTSIGSEGVPTDKQTNRQTDNPTHFLTKNNEIQQKNLKITEKDQGYSTNIESNIKEVAEILESLDAIKREIRLKFKHLTSQEMLIFSTLYQLEEISPEVTYKILSTSLKLSESSIRDYIQRIINKGIPIKKQKINNKKIILSISPDLKKIASLSTIINLREL